MKEASPTNGWDNVPNHSQASPTDGWQNVITRIAAAATNVLQFISPFRSSRDDVPTNDRVPTVGTSVTDDRVPSDDHLPRDDVQRELFGSESEPQPSRRRRNSTSETPTCKCKNKCLGRFLDADILQHRSEMKDLGAKERQKALYYGLAASASAPIQGSRTVTTTMWNVRVCIEFYMKCFAVGTKTWKHVVDLVKSNKRCV
jgi:hypothetical protein